MTETTGPTFHPPGIDLDRPNAARVYDWFLGGTTNWAIDREFGEQAVRTLPLVKTLARVNREFLGRAVRYCSRQGIRQFLDIGSGVPTVANVHEVANELDTSSRCVYVDNEPVAVAHGRILLEDEGDPQRHTIIHADLREPDEVWTQACQTGILDPDQPMAVLMAAVLHFIGPAADGAVARFRDLLPHGSYMIISHVSDDGVPPAEAGQLDRMVVAYRSSSTPDGRLRTRGELASFFTDLELVEPGIVWLPQWRMEEGPSPATEALLDDPRVACVLGGVGHKR